jgi:hypothetical protein
MIWNDFGFQANKASTGSLNQFWASLYDQRHNLHIFAIW